MRRLNQASISETRYFWEMIAILGKGFISCLISSNNCNLQLLSFQKIYTLLAWGFYETCDCEAATMRGCHLGYTDTLIVVFKYHDKKYGE